MGKDTPVDWSGQSEAEDWRVFCLSTPNQWKARTAPAPLGVTLDPVSPPPCPAGDTFRFLYVPYLLVVQCLFGKVAAAGPSVDQGGGLRTRAALLSNRDGVAP